ncbi:hypothetical protein BY996DRAFT_6602458 [Phakopsora pachyrhizi]|nr:hypothetical protein BY996DRAFT_6602458 [Phakopsora pachyrhizi]
MVEQETKVTPIIEPINLTSGSQWLTNPATLNQMTILKRNLEDGAQSFEGHSSLRRGFIRSIDDQDKATSATGFFERNEHSAIIYQLGSLIQQSGHGIGKASIPKDKQNKQIHNIPPAEISSIETACWSDGMISIRGICTKILRTDLEIEEIVFNCVCLSKRIKKTGESISRRTTERDSPIGESGQPNFRRTIITSLGNWSITIIFSDFQEAEQARSSSSYWFDEDNH